MLLDVAVLSLFIQTYRNLFLTRLTMTADSTFFGLEMCVLSKQRLITSVFKSESISLAECLIYNAMYKTNLYPEIHSL